MTTDSPPRPKRAYRTKLTHEQIAERGRRGAQIQNDPVHRAAQLVASWPELTEEQRTMIRTLLRPTLRTG